MSRDLFEDVTRSLHDRITELATKNAELSRELAQLQGKLAAAQHQLEQIVCVVEPDAGVVLCQVDAPTHFDEHGVCVYDLRYFSPLGEALISLYETLGGTVQPEVKGGV